MQTAVWALIGVGIVLAGVAVGYYVKASRLNAETREILGKRDRHE